MKIETDTLTSEGLQSTVKPVNAENTLISSPISETNSEKDKAHTPTANPWGIFVIASTFLLMIGAAYLFFALQDDFSQFHTDRLGSVWGISFLVVAIGMLLFKASFFVYTLFRYFRYKPIASVSNEELPTTTVIVPAYNEGKQVYDTLMSLAESDFPVEKLQLLAIDDGSKDDTWYWMQQAKKQLGERVTIYQQPENKGKRHALYADSIWEPEKFS